MFQQNDVNFNLKVSAPECYLPPGTKTDGLARIVGGRPADEEEHPHIVMLSYKGFGGYGQFCDGSIIHNRYVLQYSSLTQTASPYPNCISFSGLYGDAV